MTGMTAGLAATVAPLVRTDGLSVKAATEALAAAGFPAIQLDATLPGIRPKDLSARARRDLQAMAARAGMVIAGVDFFVPRTHFLRSEHVDRAMAAALAAIELAADLGRVPVSLALPVSEAGAEIEAALVSAAEGRSVPLAVHAEDELEKLPQWLDAVDLLLVGAGLDPAAALASGLDPAQTVHKLAKRLMVARLSDWGGGSSRADACRRPVGQGDLDVLSYRVAVELARKRRGPVVVDLRGVGDPVTAAGAASSAWRAAGPG